MDSPVGEWHSWDRIKLRVLLYSQQDTFIALRGTPTFRVLIYKTEVFMHRLVLLTWIGDFGQAKKLWEEEKEQHHAYRFPATFEDFLFRVLIWEKLGPGLHYDYPGFHNVKYLLLDEEEAFKLSTIPLSELLKMDKPHFSSIDGLITIDFNKQELERIAKMVPDRYKEKLRLPLILLEKIPSGYDEYEVVGTKLENMLLQKLLKITKDPFDTYDKIEEKRELTNISMLRRRKFDTVYKILPESSRIWLKIKYQNPMWKK